MQARLILHGGAWNIPTPQVPAHLQGIQHTLENIYPQLLDGASALDAVENAVRLLELDPTYDAGRGAFLNEIGEIELDAIIMDGRQLDFGAVAALQNILHPVSVARQVMEKTEHCFLVGKGAQRFAQQCGFAEEKPESLLTERELSFFHQIQNNPDFRPHHPFGPSPSDTVGAVALDRHGNLAVATSTGGTPRKLVGRVGDSPVPGAGAYADNELGAASTTGWGESILKVLLSKTACDLLRLHRPMEAARQSIMFLERKVNGLGGIIGISPEGTYFFAHNTPKMAFGYIDDGGRAQVKIHHPNSNT